MSSTTAAETLDLLEARLSRLDFIINGESKDRATDNRTTINTPAKARLAQLDRDLKSLAARSSAISDLLQLQKSHPDLFHASASNAVSNLPTAALAQLVLAHEHSYRTTTSQLNTLNDSKNIPDPSSLTKLIALQDRIGKAEVKQMEQARELAELRGRSAKIVEKWYENGVLDMGERWTEWEEKLRDCEILVRRKEAAKRREEQELG